jgi:hypothetical protein
MTETNKDNIVKGKVEYFKGSQNNHIDTPQLCVTVDEDKGFSEKEEIVVLKCSDFPELTSVKNSKELRKKINKYSDNLKRVDELKRKLESAQESYNESINVLKIKTDLEIKNLKEDNEKLKNENMEYNLRLKDVTRRINELNNLLNDL